MTINQRIAFVLLAVSVVLLSVAVLLLGAWSFSAPTPDPAHCIGPLTPYERATCEP